MFAGIGSQAKALKNIGADVNVSGNEITIKRNMLKGITVDAGDIPDAVPIISVVAAACEGDTRIINAGRLRIKESDRIKSVADMLSSVGVDASETDDGIIIHGGNILTGGTVNGYNDHRIVMALSLLCTVTGGVIDEAEAVAKSFPDFFEMISKLGIKVEKQG